MAGSIQRNGAESAYWKTDVSVKELQRIKERTRGHR